MMIMILKTYMQWALCICRFCIGRFNQPRMENIQEKIIPESSKKQNLNLPQLGNYLHSIYIVLGTTSTLEVI